MYGGSNFGGVKEVTFLKFFLDFVNRTEYPAEYLFYHFQKVKACLPCLLFGCSKIKDVW